MQSIFGALLTAGYAAAATAAIASAPNSAPSTRLRSRGVAGYPFASISRSRNSMRRILPVSVLGRSSTNSILRG
jgi:hypothetical protein